MFWLLREVHCNSNYRFYPPVTPVEDLRKVGKLVSETAFGIRGQFDGENYFKWQVFGR